MKIIKCKKCSKILDKSYEWINASAPSIVKDIICESCSKQNREQKRKQRLQKEENK